MKRLLTQLFLSLTLCASALIAQGNGTYTTPDAPAGMNQIELDTGEANDVKIKEVRVYVRMTGEWRKIKPKCITPNPGGDNVITLPANTQTGDIFEIDWETTTSQGNPIKDKKAEDLFDHTKKDC